MCLQSSCATMFYLLVNGPNHGAKRCSSCCQKKRGEYDLRTSDQLLTFVDYTNHLHLFLLGRLEHLVEAGQPEEQHRLRPGRRLEGHLVTANLMLDKTDAVGIIAWICRRRLTECMGMHCGGLLLMREFPTISYGSCNTYIWHNVVKLSVTWGKAESSISYEACGRDVTANAGTMGGESSSRVVVSAPCAATAMIANQRVSHAFAAAARSQGEASAARACARARVTCRASLPEPLTSIANVSKRVCFERCYNGRCENGVPRSEIWVST